MSLSTGDGVPIEPTEPRMRLRLYILSGTPHSEQALANLGAITESHLAGRCELEVIDVRDEPLRALHDGAVMIPTLMRAGNRERQIVGNLSDTEAVLEVLGLSSKGGPAEPP